MSTPSREVLPEQNLTSAPVLSRSARPGAKRMTLSCENCQRRKTRPACANCESLGLQCSTRKPKRKRGRHAKVPETAPTESLEGSEHITSPPNVLGIAHTPSRNHIDDGMDDITGVYATHSHERSEVEGIEHLDVPVPSSVPNHSQPFDQVLPNPQPDWSVWDSITPGAVIHHSPFSPGPGIKPLFEALSHGLMTAGILEEHLEYVASCVDLFFQKIYPTYPVVYRPILAEAIDQLAHSVYDLDHKTFALLTATCSYTLAVLPTTTSYAEDDIENPDHTSIVIRMFQSGWAHVAGKRKTSWNMLGECIRLAQAMRLHDESTYSRMSHLEGQMCRRAFWTLYTGDKSSAILGGHPVCLGEKIFRDVVPVEYSVSLGDQDTVQIETGEGTQDMSMLAGFDANQDMWRAAERLLDFDLSRLVSVNGKHEEARRSQTLLDSYLSEFHACLDDLPPCLSLYTGFTPTASSFRFQAETGSPQAPEAMAIQRTNLQVSHLCLKMLITRRIHESQSRSKNGWTQQEEGCETSSFHIAETLCIARDLLYVVHTSSIELIRLNGEACVEKIRLIGASLLELIAKNPNIPAHSALRRYQELFPHILALLDSKASEMTDG
ncbi:hypothetical protein D6C78_08791 [Aureobasidium pullulans]|uniref:Zn(2)-C6 fungal-type domain-containing protein n=1 Tax=Aureobasidium pullulans TaxID=5580 RepID=A0A4V4LDD7_AURPU|nr:hypothetical protein D6C78_08791 [Aureobasidium pullulans]